MVSRREKLMARVAFAACGALALMATSGEASAKTAAPATAAAAPRAAPPMTRADVVAKLRAEFNALDTNKDGYVSAQELAAGIAAQRAKLIAEIRQRRSAAFDAMDTNHDGQLSREEFLAGAPQPGPAPDANAVIAKLDTNKDGSLTFEEFSARALAGFDQRQAGQASQAGQVGR